MKTPPLRLGIGSGLLLVHSVGTFSRVIDRREKPALCFDSRICPTPPPPRSGFSVSRTHFLALAAGQSPSSDRQVGLLLPLSLSKKPPCFTHAGRPGREVGLRPRLDWRGSRFLCAGTLQPVPSKVPPDICPEAGALKWQRLSARRRSRPTTGLRDSSAKAPETADPLPA